MADIKWSAFTSVGALQASDQLVGLRAGVNVRFTAPIFGSQIVVVTSASQAMTTNTIYLANAPASLVTFTLPTTSEVGDRISVQGVSSNGWTIHQASGQQIFVAPTNTTLGAGGSLSSTSQYDSINLICTVANTMWASFGGGQTTGFTIV